jgi:hypothetical protein
VQAAPDIVNISAMMRQRAGLLVDVLESDRTSANRRQQLALLVDPGVAGTDHWRYIVSADGHLRRG